jgi:2'-5' RNA ligase
VRWVRPEGYHLTLRFLGNVESEAIPELAKRAADEVAGVAPFDARLGAVEIFPSPHRPRVVAAAVEPEEPLAALAGGLERAAVAAGLAAERRRFRAHLTLGRVRSRRFPSLDGATLALDGTTSASGGLTSHGVPLPVQEIVLYRSDLQREGAVYSVLERIPLAAAEAPAGE